MRAYLSPALSLSLFAGRVPRSAAVSVFVARPVRGNHLPEGRLTIEKLVEREQERVRMPARRVRRGREREEKGKNPATFTRATAVSVCVGHSQPLDYI